jgi:ABC-type antimicrobial peptide transport system permease subunit
MKKTILAALVSVIFSFPLGWIVAMLLTPVLWRLEPVLNLELAGHSGPSDWVFVVIWALIAIGLFLFSRWVLAKPKTRV